MKRLILTGLTMLMLLPDLAAAQDRRERRPTRRRSPRWTAASRRPARRPTRRQPGGQPPRRPPAAAPAVRRSSRRCPAATTAPVARRRQPSRSPGGDNRPGRPGDNRPGRPGGESPGPAGDRPGRPGGDNRPGRPGGDNRPGRPGGGFQRPPSYRPPAGYWHGNNWARPRDPLDGVSLSARLSVIAAGRPGCCCRRCSSSRLFLQRLCIARSLRAALRLPLGALRSRPAAGRERHAADRRRSLRRVRVIECSCNVPSTALRGGC